MLKLNDLSPLQIERLEAGDEVDQLIAQLRGFTIEFKKQGYVVVSTPHGNNLGVGYDLEAAWRTANQTVTNLQYTQIDSCALPLLDGVYWNLHGNPDGAVDLNSRFWCDIDVLAHDFETHLKFISAGPRIALAVCRAWLLYKKAGIE